MKPVRVSQINRYIKTVLQTDPVLGNVSVVGEVSNVKYHSSGHVYFSMKDQSSRINCFLPSDKVRYLRYPLEDGMEIIASGYIYVYEKGGSYSLNVGDITIEGTGNLSIAFEKLKARLAKEGLFDEKLKKSIPWFPKNVAIITSETGAAIRDMIRTIKNKNHYVNVTLFPCLVQGNAAAADIAATIDLVNERFPEMDVLIVGRGGGSMEELWAFNEEIVARSIFRSKCPVISAVGHETDFTIADFAADLRAATPTAAAEAAVPDTRELKAVLQEIKMQIKIGAKRKIDLFETRLASKEPDQMALLLEKRMDRYESEIQRMMQEMSYRMKELFHREERRLDQLKAAIESMNPQNIMEMGYGAVTTAEGKFIKSAAEIGIGDIVNIILKDGMLTCETKETILQQ